MALTSARNTPTLGRREPVIPVGVQAATSLFVGGLVSRGSDGYAIPTQLIASVPTDAQVVLGIVGGTYLGFPGQDPKNTSDQLIPGSNQPAGAAGAIKVEIWEGTFLLDINAGSITAADVGNLAFAVDDHTVDDDSATQTRPCVGRIVGLENGMVWVDTTDKADISDG